MNLDEYLALHVKSTEVKVAHASLKEQQRNFDAVMDDLLAMGGRPVNADELREALGALHKLHTAHLDTVCAVMFHDKV